MTKLAKTYNGGRWEIEGEDVIQVTRATMQPLGPILLFGSSKWSDFELTLEAMPFEGGGDGFKILFRAGNENSLYGVGFGSYKNRYHDIFGMFEGRWKHLEGSSNAVAGQVEYGAWHHVRVIVRGDRFSCEFNGIPLLEARDSTYRSGLIGLSTWDTLARFRNIRVRNLEGDTIWTGLPKLGAK